MFITKNWEKKFFHLNFKYYAIKNFKKEEVSRYDISTKGYPKYASDFMKDGAFDYQLYCICLLRATSDLSTDEFLEFLNYQCSQVEDPLEWLHQFDELLNMAIKFQPTPANKIRFECMREIVGEEAIGLSAAILKVEEPSVPYASRVNKVEEEFDIKKLKEELKALDTFKEKIHLLKRRRIDYLQEVKNANEKDSFVRALDLELAFQKESSDDSNEDKSEKVIGKKISCDVSPTELAEIIHDLRFMKKESGKLIFNGTTTAFTRIVTNFFYDQEGKSISENSIRKYLTKLKNKR